MSKDVALEYIASLTAEEREVETLITQAGY